MQWYRRQAIAIIACQYYYYANLQVAAQEVEVENPCLICPDGAYPGFDNYKPYYDAMYESGDPITCKEIINNAKLFETGSLWCALYEKAGSYCCPTSPYDPPDDPCILCPNGITVADDYEPNNNGDTCSDLLDYYAANFDAKYALCTVGRRASDIESRCCPSVANNPCTICPDGATAGKEFVPYSAKNRTCEDLINATLTFDADSEMCLVHAKQDEYKCCPSSTTEFNDYCNICPDGITATAGEFFIPWSAEWACKHLVQNAKIYENGTVGCNYYKGYEVSCCPRAEHTPPSTTSTTPSIQAIVGNIALVVGVASALVGAACAFAKWKQKINSTSTPTIPTTVAPSTNMTSSTPIVTATAVPQSTNVYNTLPTIPTNVATSPNSMTSSIPIVTATAVPQSANVYNTPMLSQRNITLVN
jgi:hypothetical protein